MVCLQKIILAALSFGVVYNVCAQESFYNIVKLNALPILVDQAISVEFERALNKKISLNAIMSIAPKKGLPFRSMISKFVDNSSIIDKIKLNSFSLALEGRFYLNKKKKVFQGFYLAPFIKSTKYKLNTKVDYEVLSIKGNVPIGGGIDAFSVGAAIGLQWLFSNRLALDWRIVGPSYGFSRGTLTGEKKLSILEQEVVRKQLSHLANNVPVIDLKSEVTEQGIKTTVDGPWAGIRMGISIGYNF